MALCRRCAAAQKAKTEAENPMSDWLEFLHEIKFEEENPPKQGARGQGCRDPDKEFRTQPTSLNHNRTCRSASRAMGLSIRKQDGSAFSPPRYHGGIVG